jgi:transposase InsO family protein
VGIRAARTRLRTRHVDGTIGDCFDNAVIESFWVRVQVEMLNRRRWRTHLELAAALFEYLEILSNRRHWAQRTQDANSERVRKSSMNCRDNPPSTNLGTLH